MYSTQTKAQHYTLQRVGDFIYNARLQFTKYLYRIHNVYFLIKSEFVYDCVLSYHCCICIFALRCVFCGCTCITFLLYGTYTCAYLLIFISFVCFDGVVCE